MNVCIEFAIHTMTVEYCITWDCFHYMINEMDCEDRSLLTLVNKELKSLINKKVNINALIKNGNLDTLKLMIEQHTDKYGQFMLYAIEHLQWHIVEWLSGLKVHLNICEKYTPYITLVTHNKLDLMKMLYNAGYTRFDDMTFSFAIQSGNIEMLEWLYDNGCTLDGDTFNAAIRDGNFDVMEWLKNKQCPQYGDCYNVAAMKGIEYLEWLYNNGCRLDSDIFSEAIRDGNFELMEWLKDKKCEWDGFCYNVAAMKGIEYIRWLEHNGCPSYPHEEFYYHNGCPKVLKWLHKRGYIDEN